MRIVLDTNVLVAGLRSRFGASYRILQMLGSAQFQPLISPPLCLEIEDVLGRPGLLTNDTKQEIDDFLDFYLSQCVECRIYFLWRPYLPDPKDDLLLELALAGNADFIVTHNTRDFRGVDAFGIQAVTPAKFLGILHV